VRKRYAFILNCTEIRDDDVKGWFEILDSTGRENVDNEENEREDERERCLFILLLPQTSI
jgi:hypothetical protein